MGIKLAKGMGHDVVAISHNSDHYNHAVEKGADRFVNGSDPESLESERGKIDLILNTTAAHHDL